MPFRGTETRQDPHQVPGGTPEAIWSPEDICSHRGVVRSLRASNKNGGGQTRISARPQLEHKPSLRCWNDVKTLSHIEEDGRDVSQKSLQINLVKRSPGLGSGHESTSVCWGTCLYSL